MRSVIRASVASLVLLILAACSSESDEVEAPEDHVWEGQVEAIDKAREVETILKRKHDRQEQQ